MDFDRPCAASPLVDVVVAELRGDATVDGALRSLVVATCAETGVDIAEAWVPRSDGVTLDRRAVHGVESGSPGAAPVSTYRGGGLAGIAWADARIELRQAAGDARHLRAESMRLGVSRLDGAAAVPIVFGDDAVGVISLFALDDASRLPADVESVVEAIAPLRHHVGAHVFRARLVESENRFHALADSSPTLIWASRPNRSIEFANRALLELAGMEQAELSLRWYHLIHPDDRETCERTYVDAYLNQDEFELEYRLRDRNGSYRDILERGAARLSPDGEFLGLIGTGLDVTGRVGARDLERQNRSESAGQLATGVAHDVNNVLATIVANAERIALSTSEEAEAAAAEIVDTAGRASELIQEILSLVRAPEPVPTEIDVVEVITDLEGMLRQLVGARVELVISVDPGLRPVRFRRTEMYQVLVNLVVNARDAMPDGGVLTIEARSGASFHPGDSRGVRLRVSDTGSGMEPVVAARAFEPFFTTKEKGTGIGLTTVQRLVTAQGGTIAIESAEGQGTAVTVDLPPSPAAG